MRPSLRLLCVSVFGGVAVLRGFAEAPATAPAPAVPAPAAPAAPAVDPAATAVWQKHIEGMGSRGDGGRDVNFEQFFGKALEFFEKYPNERRVSGILYNVASFGDWIKGPDAPRIRREWRAYLQKALADTLANHPWPDNVWAGLHWVGAKNDLAIQLEETGRPDLTVFQKRLAIVAARAPAAPHRAFMEQQYIGLLEENDQAALVPYLQQLEKSDVADIAALGRGQLAVQQLRVTPMELKFTAVDGREVDLAQLRGQVVLIDCWATWCVPCIKELPNVKAALAKFGPKGFTVVGMSFDRLPDRAKLVKFIADEKLDWPHWFNEKGGANSFAKQYNIRSIPATFLLGKDGRLVTTDTHGEKLDAALQKLLGQ